MKNFIKIRERAVWLKQTRQELYIQSRIVALSPEFDYSPFRMA
jgi:hypothetical protein